MVGVNQSALTTWNNVWFWIQRRQLHYFCRFWNDVKQFYDSQQSNEALTDNNEGVVDVDAAEAVGGFADVRARVVRLHLLDLQATAKDTESYPATVDVASILGPHYQGRRVSIYWTRQFNGTSESRRLSVNDLVRYPWWSCRKTDTVTVYLPDLIKSSLEFHQMIFGKCCGFFKTSGCQWGDALNKCTFVIMTCSNK